MVKQGWAVERALRAGLQQGMQWLIHCDPDELMYPQTESFDIATGASQCLRYNRLHTARAERDLHMD